MPVSFVLVYAHPITQHYSVDRGKHESTYLFLPLNGNTKYDSVCPHDRWIWFDLILISQSAMPFFPGREHIYGIRANIQKWQHTYTTEQLQHKHAENCYAHKSITKIHT